MASGEERGPHTGDEPGANPGEDIIRVIIAEEVAKRLGEHVGRIMPRLAFVGCFVVALVLLAAYMVWPRIRDEAIAKTVAEVTAPAEAEQAERLRYLYLHSLYMAARLDEEGVQRYNDHSARVLTDDRDVEDLVEYAMEYASTPDVEPALRIAAARLAYRPVVSGEQYSMLAQRVVEGFDAAEMDPLLRADLPSAPGLDAALARARARGALLALAEWGRPDVKEVAHRLFHDSDVDHTVRTAAATYLASLCLASPAKPSNPTALPPDLDRHPGIRRAAFVLAACEVSDPEIRRWAASLAAPMNAEDAATAIDVLWQFPIYEDGTAAPWQQELYEKVVASGTRMVIDASLDSASVTLQGRRSAPLLSVSYPLRTPGHAGILYNALEHIADVGLRNGPESSEFIAFAETFTAPSPSDWNGRTLRLNVHAFESSGATVLRPAGGSPIEVDLGSLYFKADGNGRVRLSTHGGGTLVPPDLGDVTTAALVLPPRLVHVQFRLESDSAS